MTAAKFSQYLVLFVITFLVSGYSPPVASQIDDMLTKLAEQDLFSGSVLVAKDGEVLLTKGYGMANLELEVANTPQTKFRIGSITKQFTAMAILQLQQQEKLNVNDLICQYIEDCPEAWQPITIHQLLTHTSGIYNFTNASSYLDFKMQHANATETIGQFRDRPLDFSPGETWSYSNSGYILLGYIIEEVSGQSYASFLKDNIFEPLQMTATGYDNNDRVIKNRASGYSSKSTNADYIDMSVPHAAGGLYSTVEDLFLWDQALYTDTLIPASLREEMFTPFAQIPDTELSYGYGWLVDTQLNHKRVSHSGGIEGFVTEIDRYPDDGVVIIVLSNLERTLPDTIALGIAKMVFGEE